MAIDRGKLIKSTLAELKKAGLPQTDLFISDGVLNKYISIEDSLNNLMDEREKWEGKAGDAAAMASPEFKKFSDAQTKLAGEMKTHLSNIKKADEMLGKMMTKHRADKKLSPLLVKMNPLLGAAVLFCDPAQNKTVKPVKSTAKPVPPPQSAKPNRPLSKSDDEPIYDRTPQNVPSGRQAESPYGKPFKVTPRNQK